MHKKQYLIPILFSLFTSVGVIGQQKDGIVQLSGGELHLSNNISSGNFNKNQLSESLFNSRYHVLIQFVDIPDADVQKKLKDHGVHIGLYLNHHTYMAVVDTGFDFNNARSFGIASVDVIPSHLKSKVESVKKSGTIESGSTMYSVSLFHPSDQMAAIQMLNESGIRIAETKYQTPGMLLVQPDRNRLALLTQQPFVSFVGSVNIKDHAINYNDIATHSISALQNPLGRNLNGQGMIVGLGDNADINTHIDFSDKTITRMPWPPSSHGTHTGGTIAGGGFLNPRNKGMAPAAHLIDQWFSDIVVNTPVYLFDYNMPVTNNSYHSADLGCEGNQIYNLLSYYADQQAIDLNDKVLHVFAAGNDGAYTCGSYPNAYGTIKTGWQVAKNVITVGAMDQATYQIASFSSRGPALDGRIKPEIVANGFATVSTYPYNTYATNYGTSMAAPVVTGVVASLQQWYRQQHSGATAPASLIKGVLCNSSEDLGNPGPDYTYGFGMLNAERALKTLEENRYFSGISVQGGGVINYPISVPSGARRLKVMLLWADEPGAVNSPVSLVNDLDLTVSDPSSVLHFPLILDPINVTSVATEGPDHINNIEQSVIDNPAPGNYVLNVSPYSIPTGSQNFFLVYQIDMNGVVVEYPSGGETWVPGETERIRWSGYGSESNGFTISYSGDNGSTWNDIGSALSDARSISWVVPNLPGNQYLIRVSRDGTSLSDQSDQLFTILGQPSITTSVPCEGFAQLSWPAINGATGYRIFKLKSDSMSVVGNTTSLDYLVSGLSSTDSSWLAVAAEISGTLGRRSIAVKVKPFSGACGLSQFDHNLKAVAIVSPVSGRQFTSTELPAMNSVKLRIRNLDNIATSGSYEVFYQINGGSVVSETSSAIIPPLSDVEYSFTPVNSFSSPGVYRIKAWVKRIGDLFPDDDTTFLTIRNLSNPPLTLPFSDGFETTSIATYNSTMGIDGDDHVDISSSTERGRARTFVNTGLAYSGNRAITLDQYPYGNLNSDSLTMTFNLSGYDLTKQLRVDFLYKNHGQPDAPGNRVWLRGKDDAAWTPAYDLNANQPELGQWKSASININDAMDTLMVSKLVSSSFQLRFGQEAYTSVNVVDPYFDQDDGYTFDDIKIAEAIHDVALLKIVSPGLQACGLGNSNTITLRVRNYSNTPRTNISLNYRINGGATVSQMLSSIGVGVTQDISFGTTADLSAYQDYRIEAWISSPGDNYASNDSILDFLIHNSPVVDTYPYLEGFEDNNGHWYSKGTNNSWEWGTPDKQDLTRSANGSKGWFTSLEGGYNDNEKSYLYSPCFDISTLAQPMLSFSFINHTEDDYDFSWVEYSTDGVVWLKLGTAGEGTNWYNNSTLNLWDQSKPYWHVASIPLPVVAGIIKIRFVMLSDVGVTEEGLGIDDIHIFDAVDVYTGSDQTINQPVSGVLWQPVVAGGEMIAAVNAEGQDLGSVQLSVYGHTGAVRYSNNAYYLNRSFVVQSTNNLSSPIKLRLFITNSEVEEMRNASDCSTCSPLSDAYQLGVTKYSGDATDENNSLSDDQGGFFQFIPKSAVQIVPYNEGYYLEFAVSGLSEFWISKASVQSTSNYCPGSDIHFTSVLSGSAYQWQVDSGSGFQNIISGPVYSGYNSPVLQFTSAPGSLAGNRYRCVVDGTNGPAIPLHFRNVWTGQVSNQWMNASNWSCGSIPDQFTDVFIPGSTNYQPVLSVSTSVRSATIYDGGELNAINASVLTVNGSD